MVKVIFSGPMESSTLAPLKRTSAMARASSSGKMGGNTTDNGSAENKAVQASTRTIMASVEKVSGKTENAKSG